MNIDDLLAKTKYNPDKTSHLLPNQEDCRACKNRYCETVCPAKVYEWDEEKQKLQVTFENCLECGACRIICPTKSIEWHYPKPNKGITYKNS